MIPVITKDIADRYIRYIGLEDLKKVGDTHYYAKCPYCKKKGISVRERKFYILTTKGVNVYCHRCGTRKSFANFLSDFSPSTLESINGEIFFGKKAEVELILEPPKPKKIVKATPDILQSLPKVKDNAQASAYCSARKFPEVVFEEFYYCENYQSFAYLNHLTPNPPFKKLDPRIVIPYFDDHKELTHIQGRSIDPNEKKFRYQTLTIIEGAPKIWGLDRINKTQTINICEGVFDAVFVDNSLAIGSAFADLTVMKEKGIALHNVTFCFDHDIETNRQLREGAKRYLDMGAKLFFWEKYKYFGIKDFNDFIKSGNTIEALNKMIKDNSCGGLMAKVKLKMV